MNICEKKGKIGIVSGEYDKFKGGRQSRKRLKDNIEYVITIDCSQSSSSASRREIRRVLLLKKLLLLQKRMFSKDFLEAVHARGIPGRGRLFISGGKGVLLRVDRGLFIEISDDISSWGVAPLEELCLRLEEGLLDNHGDEIALLLDRLEEAGEADQSLLKEIPPRLRMLAHKNTRKEFTEYLHRLEILGQSMVFPNSFIKKIQSIKTQGEKRFKG